MQTVDVPVSTSTLAASFLGKTTCTYYEINMFTAAPTLRRFWGKLLGLVWHIFPGSERVEGLVCPSGAPVGREFGAGRGRKGGVKRRDGTVSASRWLSSDEAPRWVINVPAIFLVDLQREDQPITPWPR